MKLSAAEARQLHDPRRGLTPKELVERPKGRDEKNRYAFVSGMREFMHRLELQGRVERVEPDRWGAQPRRYRLVARRGDRAYRAAR